jgi:hypothetical protein
MTVLLDVTLPPKVVTRIGRNADQKKTVFLFICVYQNQRRKAARLMSKQQSSGRKRKESQRQGLQGKWIGILALAGLLILIVYFTWQETGGSGGLSAAEVGDPALGPADAPVVITEYADFGCSACRAWHNYGIRAAIEAGDLELFNGTPDTHPGGFVVNCPVPILAPNTFEG